MGSLITQELAIRRPDLLGACVVMRSAAKPTGWVRDYAAFLCPSSALSDAETLRNIMAHLHSDDWTEGNEQFLVPQWQACNDYDVTQSLPRCEVSLHVIGFEQDVQAPPVWGREVARLAPNADLSLTKTPATARAGAHKHVEINRAIESALNVPVID